MGRIPSRGRGQFTRGCGSHSWHCGEYKTGVAGSIIVKRAPSCRSWDYTQRMWNRGESHGGMRRFAVYSPNEDCFSPDVKVCSSPHPSPLPGSQGESPHHLWFPVPKLCPPCGYASLARKRAAVLPTLTLPPRPSFAGTGSNSRKSSFFAAQPRPGWAFGNGTPRGASIVWAIQWAFHFQSKSKLVKVSLHPLPCRAAAACITITIMLFCHVRSKG